MLRMSVKNGEYIMVGDDVKIVFLGGGGGQTRIMSLSGFQSHSN